MTLACELDMPELLTRIDTGPGCSIKDSFASLELTDAGFEVLFDATWIVRLPGGETPSVHDPAWEAVRDGDAIEGWEQAWRGDDGPTGLFRPELLDNPAVTIIQVRTSDGVVAGAVLYRSPDATGISNFFARPGAPTSAWAGCLSFADTLHAGSALVSYASGAALDAARSTGFVAGGRLRVWHRTTYTSRCPPAAASSRAASGPQSSLRVGQTGRSVRSGCSVATRSSPRAIGNHGPIPENLRLFGDGGGARS